MRLTIDDLRVDSYSSQVSELELTEVKGGTTPFVADIIVALVEVVKPFLEAVIPESTTTVIYYDSQGNKISRVVVKH
jgi:hypothetical protein